MELDEGILIAFEGIDGAGKTTQVEAIREALESIGLVVVRTKEPTRGRWGMQLRRSAFDGRLNPQEELDLFMRDREDHHVRLLRPGIANGAVLLVDRYFGSSAAYQGSRGLDTPVSILEANEQRFIAPDLMLLLEVEPEVGRARIAARGDVPNEFEGLEQLRSVAHAFDQLDRPYIVRVDGTETAEEVTRHCLRVIAEGPLFSRLCRKPYLSACEPEHCGYRRDRSCRYLDGASCLGRLPSDNSDIRAVLGNPDLTAQQKILALAAIE